MSTKEKKEDESTRPGRAEGESMRLVIMGCGGFIGSHLLDFSTSEIYGRTIARYVDDTDYTNPDLYELDEDSTPLIMGSIRNQRWSYATSKQTDGAVHLRPAQEGRAAVHHRSGR